jgi:hypothetical protein
MTGCDIVARHALNREESLPSRTLVWVQPPGLVARHALNVRLRWEGERKGSSCVYTERKNLSGLFRVTGHGDASSQLCMLLCSG